MRQTFTQSLVLTCVLLHTVVSYDDCIYAMCECMDASIDCQARGLSSLPAETSSANTHFSSLNLNMNGITVIPAGRLLPSLTEIFLEENPTTVIEDTAFDESASTLETLSFSMAQFKRIPDAFGHLLALKSLTISSSNIKDWNQKAMNNISKTLQSLVLENVGMTSWPSWIHNFSQLTELSLDSSSISFIPDNAFDNVNDSLITLSLNSNSLTSVPKALSGLRGLQTLYLARNQITDVSWLPRASKLFRLTLDSNLISDAKLLSDSVQPFGESLTELDINANRLTAIPNLTLLTHVGSLDLSNNRISDPLSGALPHTLSTMYLSYNLLPSIPRVMATLFNVHGLNLPSNSIRQIRGTDFSPSTSWADFSNNLITELNDNSFLENSKLGSLSFNNNPIALISKLAFQHLTQLTELSLQNAKLTRIPLAISSLTSLFLLDMTGNVNLICTCTTKSLEERIMSVPHVNVRGDCGHMSIYEFFSELSPSCPSQRDTET